MRLNKYFDLGLKKSVEYADNKKKQILNHIENSFADGYFTGAKDVYRDLEIIKSNLGLYESKIREVVEYLKDDTDKMYAAKTVSILLGCDFRDSKEVAEKYLKGKTE